VALLSVAAAAHFRRFPEQIPALLRALAISGTLAALYGIGQFFGFDPLQPAAAYRAGEGIWSIVRPPGTLGHADYFGVYLLFVAFSAAALWAIEKQPRWKAACAVSCIALALSGTRAALLGLAAGALFVAIRLRPRLRFIHAATAAALCVAFVAFYISPMGTPVRARVRWASDDARGGARLLLWRDSLRMAAARPLLGYGPETFALEFPRFQSVELARAYPDFYHESPHNMFLDALTAQGAPGLLTLALFPVLGIAAALRARANWLAGGLLAVLVAQQFACFVLPNALLFGIFVAILTALAPVSDAKPARFGVPRAVFWAAAIPMLWLAARLFASDVFLERFKASCDGRDVAAASRNYARSRAWAPGGSSSDLYYSRRMFALAADASNTLDKLAALQQAITGAMWATRTSEDRQNAWYNAAVLSGRGNDAAAAERSLRSAIAAAPNWFKPHWTLARILQAEGRQKEALAEAARAVDLDGGKNPEVAKTLADIVEQQKGTK